MSRCATLAALGLLLAALPARGQTGELTVALDNLNEFLAGWGGACVILTPEQRLHRFGGCEAGEPPAGPPAQWMPLDDLDPNGIRLVVGTVVIRCRAEGDSSGTCVGAGDSQTAQAPTLLINTPPPDDPAVRARFCSVLDALSAAVRVAQGGTADLVDETGAAWSSCPG